MIIARSAYFKYFAHHPHRIFFPVLFHKSILHSFSFVKSAMAFFKMSLSIFTMCNSFSASLALLPLVSFFLFPGMHSADLPGRLFSNYAASSHLLQGPLRLDLHSFLLPVSFLLLKV